MKKFISLILVCNLSFALTSCGYQLRGSIDTAGLDNIRILSDSRNSISKILEKKFSINRQPNITNTSKYPAIKIINITSKKRQLSVNSSGRVDEYEISKTLRYQFIFSEDNKIVGSIKASASYDFNESQMQGTKEKESITNNNIDRTLVRMLLNKFKSVLKSNS
tara:strand:- start:2685 stop:3176 length:492 start_codon:yes stop_codon:yes gene_type:complete